METPTILLVGAPCEDNCSSQDSVREGGAQLLVELSSESAAEILSSCKVDGVLIHQDNVGFGSIVASQVQTHWPDKPQTMVCQECVKKPLVPFGAEGLENLKALGEPQRSGNYRLFPGEGLLTQLEGKVDRSGYVQDYWAAD